MKSWRETESQAAKPRLLNPALSRMVMFPEQVFGSTLLRVEVEAGSASSPASAAGSTITQIPEPPFAIQNTCTCLW